jgi:hypothetical protein
MTGIMDVFTLLRQLAKQSCPVRNRERLSLQGTVRLVAEPFSESALP